MLIGILVVLWRTRGATLSGGLPITRPGSVYPRPLVSASGSGSPMSTSQYSSRLLRDTGRIGTLSSTLSGMEEGGGLAKIGLGPPVERPSASEEKVLEK